MSEQTLPKGWVESTLGEINFHAPKTFDPKKSIEEECELYSVPVFFKGQPERVVGKEIGSSKQHVEPGDVLICKINPRINRVWSVGPSKGRSQIASSEWITVRQSRLDSRYLKYYFQSLEFRNWLCADVSGVGGSLTRAKPKLVAGYRVPICAPDEQKGIADQLDKLLAQVNNLKARLDTIPTILKRFRQSVLAAAVSGQLYSWGEVSGSKVSYKSVGIEGLDIPTKWLGRCVGNVVNRQRKICYGVVQPGNEVNEGVGLIRVCDIGLGKVGWNGLRKISFDLDRQYQRSRVSIGDVLVTVVGAIGRVGLVDKDVDANIARAVARLSPDDSVVEPKFLWIWLSSPAVQWWLTISSKEVARKTLNLKELKELPIGLPSLDEQKGIVRRVDQLFAFADRIEKQVEAAQSRVNKLTQSILAKAFRGELTADWRAENPELISGEHSAEALLARIKAEKEKLESAKSRRKRKPASESVSC